MPLQRIPGAMVSDSTIIGADVLNSSLTGADVLDASLAGADIQDSSLTGADVQDGSLGRNDMGESVLNLATAVATTSGTFREITGIPSWARRVVLMLNGVSTNGTSDLLVQLGVGTTPLTSGYLNGQSIFAWGSGVLSATSAAGIPIFNNAAAYIFSGRIVIERIEATANNWLVTATLNNTQTSPAMVISSGVAPLSGPLGMVRLTTVGGTATFDAGSMNISWE
jgi:hypothetical protein